MFNISKHFECFSISKSSVEPNPFSNGSQGLVDLFATLVANPVVLRRATADRQVLNGGERNRGSAARK